MEIRTLFLFLATKLLMHYLVGCLSMTIPNITTDQSALLALKSSLILDPNSILVTNWTTRTSVCNWIGVVCGHRHKRVIALNIPSMGLVSTLPPNLGNLSFLVRLNMYNNSFYGHLPEDLAKLRRLKYISVRLNNLGGQMPSWLGSLRNLQILFLGNNSFTGTFLSYLILLSLPCIYGVQWTFLFSNLIFSCFYLSNASKLEALIYIYI